DLVYAVVRQGREELVLAEGTLGALSGDYTVVERLPGSRLVGVRYRGPFDDLPPQRGNEHHVIPWKDVGAEEGTGIVHIAPGCGAEDFALSKEHGLPVIAPIDEFGVFIDGFGSLVGKKTGEAAEPIIQHLRATGRLYKVEPYTHRYPVCWRCETELVFRLVDEWFIAMDPVREQLKQITQRIHWIPDFGLDRELDWLRNMHDWMISKKRYWGLALPIYECAKCGHVDVIASAEELRARAVAGWQDFEGHSPHRPWIDAVKIRCSKCGATVSRIADVGNPWLDAGIVSFSTMGYRTHPDIRRRFVIPLWNVVAFFVTYANLESFDFPSLMHTRPGLGTLDRWLLSRANRLAATVQEHLDEYDPAGASRPVEAFVDDLSNWYVRRSRRRFWKSEDDDD